MFWIKQIYLFRQVGSVDDVRSQDSETQVNHFQHVHQAQNCLEIPVLSKDALLLSYYGVPADVLGKLGPSLIWRQIGPAIFLGCDKLGPKITVTERRKTLPLHC